MFCSAYGQEFYILVGSFSMKFYVCVPLRAWSTESL